MKAFLLPLIALAAGVASAVQSAVDVRTVSATMPTYPYGDPDPVASASPLRYPYFCYDGQSATSRPQAWETVVLSNGRIEVTAIPAIGGKIWGAKDLSTGRAFFYTNDAVKFRDIAMRGPWCSGGIEFNFGLTGHAQWTTAPVDWTVRRNDDGSASYFCGGYEFVTRTFWQVEVLLRPGEDFFTARFVWHNGGGQPCTRYQWSNSAVTARGNPEMIYPGAHQINHDGTPHPWPVDEKGIDRSFFANDGDLGSTSWHVINGDNRFFGAWWDEWKFGMWHRNSAEDKFGRKIFMWGQARSGDIWEDLLTDHAGQYIELQSGRGLQQQQAGCERTPFKYQTLHPGATDLFEEQWGCAHDRAVYDAAKAFPCGEIARPLKFPADYDTNSVYALWRDGEQKMRSGEAIEAAKLLAQTLAKDPCFVPALGELAAFELRRGNFTKAESLAEKALAVDTYDGPANFITGEIALEANRLARARERFGIASLDANYRPAALVRLGMIACREGNFTTAATCAEKALVCSAYDPEAHQLAAVAARLSSDRDGAKRAVAKGLVRTPIHYGLRYENGEDPATLAKCELPGPTLVETGLWYAKAGLTDDAKRIWSAAPKDPIAKLLAGDRASAAALPVEFVFPHGHEAIAALEAAVKADASWKFKYYLAIALAPFGEEARARELLAACGTEPDAAVFYLVRAQHAKGAAAVDDLKRAAKLDDSWRVGCALVATHLEAKNPTAAIEVANAYRAKYPGLQQLDSAAVNALVAAERYAEAVAILEKMHVLPSEFNRVIPDQWNLCHRKLAEAALQTGDRATALKHRAAVMAFPENLGAGRPVKPAAALENWPDELRLDYLDLMETAVDAYSDARIRDFLRDVRERGLYEHGFPRLAANLNVLVANGRQLNRRQIAYELMDECFRQMPTARDRARMIGKRRSSVGNDFAVKEIVLALKEVESRHLYPQETIERWKDAFRPMRAEDIYNALPKLGDPTAHNWCVFGAASEQARLSAGLGGDPAFVERYVADQMRFFDENGMYRDPHEPAVYDFVTRLQFAAILSLGYDGPSRKKLEETLDRAAEPTLAMLSACGEIPYGGRSNQFLHNHTVYSALCDWYAARYLKRGEKNLAARFANASRRSLDALKRWLDDRPIHHVKNRYPIDSGIGCENYAYFDKYMITMGSWLMISHALWPEASLAAFQPIPADPRPRRFETSDAFHWIFLSAGDYSAQIDYRANEHYDATGLGRLHRRGAPPQICLSTPCAAHPNYRLAEAKSEALAFGPLAGCDWSYELSEKGLRLEAKGKGKVGLVLPVFLFDGAQATDVSVGSREIAVRYRGWVCRYETDGRIVRTGRTAENRNGRYARFEAHGEDAVVVRIRLDKCFP